MTVKIDGTNTVANPAFTGADTDTGLQCGTNELNLVTGGTTQVKVDSSGNVGVGVTPSSWGGSRNAIQFDSAGAAYLCNDSTMGIASNFYFDGSANKYINAGSASALYVQNDNIVFDFAGSGSGGASASFSTRVRIDNDGLKFNTDTAAANALDDYEEGTWTPELIGNTTNGTWTPNSSNGGFYVKIGKQVTAWFNANGVLSGAAGFVRVNALPFTAAANQTPSAAGNAIYSSGSIQYWSGAGAQVLGPLIEPSTTKAYFHVYATNSSAGAQLSVVNTTHNLHAFVTYFVA